MKSFRGKIRVHASRERLHYEVEDERFLRLFSDFAKLISTSVKLCDPNFPEDDVNYIEELLGLSFVLLQANIRRVSEAAATASLLTRLADLDKTKTSEQFAQAIQDRGLILVHVSREEAAKAINRQNRAFKEGFAVVDRRGKLYQVNQDTTGDASKARALGGSYKDKGKSLAELVWAVGNYYKHCDEWGRSVWEDKTAREHETNALRQSRNTRRIIEKVGIKRCTTGSNMRIAYNFFEIDWASDCTPLAVKVQEWANAVYELFRSLRSPR